MIILMVINKVDSTILVGVLLSATLNYLDFSSFCIFNWILQFLQQPVCLDEGSFCRYQTKIWFIFYFFFFFEGILSSTHQIMGTFNFQYQLHWPISLTSILCFLSHSKSSELTALPRNRSGNISTGKSRSSSNPNIELELSTSDRLSISEPPELSGDVLSTESSWCWRREFRLCGTSDGVICNDLKPIRVSVSPIKPVMSSLARAQRSKYDSHHSGYDCWNVSKLSGKSIRHSLLGTNNTKYLRYISVSKQM